MKKEEKLKMPVRRTQVNGAGLLLKVVDFHDLKGSASGLVCRCLATLRKKKLSVWARAVRRDDRCV